jgi:hypothetical protein
MENKTDDIKDNFYDDKLSKYNMNILLENVNAKVSREGIFKLTN